MNEPDTSELNKILKSMTLDELKLHEKASLTTNRYVSLGAIGMIFGTLVFPNALTIVITGLGCYVLAHFSIGVSVGLGEIRKHIAKFQKTDK
jgi:hypothetical protein